MRDKITESQITEALDNEYDGMDKYSLVREILELKSLTIEGFRREKEGDEKCDGCEGRGENYFNTGHENPFDDNSWDIVQCPKCKGTGKEVE